MCGFFVLIKPFCKYVVTNIAHYQLISNLYDPCILFLILYCLNSHSYRYYVLFSFRYKYKPAGLTPLYFYTTSWKLNFVNSANSCRQAIYFYFYSNYKYCQPLACTDSVILSYKLCDVFLFEFVPCSTYHPNKC